MLPSSKWIDGIDATGSVHDAARRTLESRLTAVIYALPLAAYLAEHDVEHVHRLRVSTRRAVAAVELYDDWLPRKLARWLKKRLKRIRKAAGDARDLDVLSDRLKDEYGGRAAPVIELITTHRAAVQPVIVKIANRCRRNDRFIRTTSKLLATIQPPKNGDREPTSFKNWATDRLAASVEQFFAAVPDDSADTVALHQFRIRAKELRYTIELVAAAFSSALRSEHYPVVEELQERLGKIQDYVAANARLIDWAKETDDDELKSLLNELADAEREHLIDAVGDFRDWWTDERAHALRAGLAQSQPEEQGEATPSPEVAHQT